MSTLCSGGSAGMSFSQIYGFSVFEVVTPKNYLFTLRESDLLEGWVPELHSVKYDAPLANSETQMNQSLQKKEEDSRANPQPLTWREFVGSFYTTATPGPPPGDVGASLIMRSCLRGPRIE